MELAAITTVTRVSIIGCDQAKILADGLTAAWMLVMKALPVPVKDFEGKGLRVLFSDYGNIGGGQI